MKIFLLFALFILSGCTKLGPNFTQPEAKISATYLEVDGSAIPAGDAQYPKWWEVFGDEKLSGLIDLAYRQNLSLQRIAVQIFEARAALEIALGSRYPQVQQGVGSIDWGRDSEYGAGASRTPDGMELDLTSLSSRVGASASWELDFWGKYSRGIEAAEAQYWGALSAYDQALVSLVGEVGTNYIVIRTLEEELRIAYENVRLQREGLDIADARFKGGATGARDVQQAMSLVYTTEAIVPSIKSQLYQAKNALAVLLGVTPLEIGELLGGEAHLPQAPGQVLVGIPADLLRRRPDIRLAEYRARQQSALIGVAEAELYPSFSLTGFFGFSATDAGRSDLGDTFTWGARTVSGGPSFKWNVLNYGRLTNAVRVQDARYEQALLEYRETVLKAHREVQDGLVVFVQSQEVASRLALAVEAARKSLDLALTEYRNGATDYTTVLSAQQVVLTREGEWVRAKGQTPQALIAIYRALGGGWGVRNGRDVLPADVRERMQKRTDWGDLLDENVTASGDQTGGLAKSGNNPSDKASDKGQSGDKSAGKSL